MGSPKRHRKDQSSRGDIRDRLQALAKSGSSRGGGSVNRGMSKSTSMMNTVSRNNRQDRSKKEKISTAIAKKDSMGQVMERARAEGGNRWTKKLLEEEAKNPERWGHSGFKELYKSELELKYRRSQSRERTRRSRSRSRSRDRNTRQMHGREKEGENSRYKSHLRSDSSNRNNLSRKRENRGLKRSLSSSDRSLVGLASCQSSKAQDSGRNREHELRRSQKYSAKSSDPPETRTAKGNKTNSEQNKSGRTTTKDRKQESVSKEWLSEKNRSFSDSPSPNFARNHSPVRVLKKTGRIKKRTLSLSSKPKRGPSSPSERSPLSRVSESSNLRSRRSQSLSNRSSRSQSSSSQSRTSRSRSSSSSSDYSSSASTSPGSHSHLPPHSPSPRHSHFKTKDAKKQASKRELSLQLMINQHGNRNDYDKCGIIKASPTEHVFIQAGKKYHHSHPHTHLKLPRTESESSSNPSSSESDGFENGDDDGEDRIVGSNNKSADPVPRLSLSERFGKLAQLSSQRRSLELVQLRIVAPVGQSNCEKNVSVDESCAAPVITKVNKERSHSTESQSVGVSQSPEMTRLEERERLRDDRWRDWHERYDQYQHVQPPRHLPRDWDDIRVRHKYYTERGYFGRDMTLDELSRWEDWWHRYQQWRRGYERAWAATHGPHVPVEYPDWTNYRSSHHRESPAAAAAAAAVVAAAAAGSIRSRLGWRR